MNGGAHDHSAGQHLALLHQRRVASLKKLLPAVAVLVLIMLAVWPLVTRQDFSFFLSKGQVSSVKGKLATDQAVYRGSDTNGRPFSISFKKAVQPDPAVDAVNLSGLDAAFYTSRGKAQVTAPRGRYDLASSILNVEGPVNFTSEDGSHLTMGAVQIDMKTGVLSAGKKIVGRIPLGNFQAEHAHVTADNHRLVLGGGVSMRVNPRKNTQGKTKAVESVKDSVE